MLYLLCRGWPINSFILVLKTLNIFCDNSCSEYVHIRLLAALNKVIHTGITSVVYCSAAIWRRQLLVNYTLEYA